MIALQIRAGRCYLMKTGEVRRVKELSDHLVLWCEPHKINVEYTSNLDDFASFALEEFTVFNQFLVGSVGNCVVVLNPPGRGQQLTKQEALILAAYLVALGDDNNEFADVLKKAQEGDG